MQMPMRMPVQQQEQAPQIVSVRDVLTHNDVPPEPTSRAVALLLAVRRVLVAEGGFTPPHAGWGAGAYGERGEGSEYLCALSHPLVPNPDAPSAEHFVLSLMFRGNKCLASFFRHSREQILSQTCRQLGLDLARYFPEPGDADGSGGSLAAAPSGTGAEG